MPQTWQFWTWNDYYRDCKLFAKTLIKLDVQPFHIINILGFNSVSRATLSSLICLQSVFLYGSDYFCFVPF